MILAIIDGDRVEVEFFYTDSKNDVTWFSRCVHLLHVLVLACNIFCSDAISTFFFWITFVKLYKIYFFPILLLNKNRDRKNSTYTITHGVMRLCIVTCVTSNDAGTAWKLRIAICSVFFFVYLFIFSPRLVFRSNLFDPVASRRRSSSNVGWLYGLDRWLASWCEMLYPPARAIVV